MEVTQEPEFDVGELSSTGRQVEVSLGGAVQLACPPGKLCKNKNVKTFFTTGRKFP